MKISIGRKKVSFQCSSCKGDTLEKRQDSYEFSRIKKMSFTEDGVLSSEDAVLSEAVVRDNGKKVYVCESCGRVVARSDWQLFMLLTVKGVK